MHSIHCSFSIKILIRFILLGLLYFPILSFGQNQPYLEGLPSRNDIINKIKGNNPIAALQIMCDVIIFHQLEEEPKNERTAKENSLLAEYNSWGKLIDEYSNNIEPLETPEKRREFQVYSHNLITDELRKNLANNLFSNEAKTQYEEVSKLRNEERLLLHQAKVADREEKKGLENHKTSAIISIIFGIAFLVGWVKLRLGIGKRQFNRRNQHGVEEFDSHGDLVKKRLAEESVGWLSFFVLIIGLGLIVYGVYLISLMN
jgi:hypothetical protein